MGNTSSSKGRSLPESRIVTLQQQHGLSRSEICYLHDRYVSLDFSHASEKFQSQEDRGELATLLAEDWLFKLVISELKVSEGMTFDRYLEAYVKWIGRSIEEKLDVMFSVIVNYDVSEGGEEPDLASAFEIAAFLGKMYQRDLSADDAVVIRYHGTTMKGWVRYLGPVKGIADPFLVGVELDHGKGDTDGTFKTKRYFTCKENHGIFVKEKSVELLTNFDLAKSWIFTIKGIAAPADTKKVPPLDRRAFVKYLKQQDWVIDLLSNARLVPSKLF